MSAPTTDPAPTGRRALLADGTVVHVRRLRPDDGPVVAALHRDLPAPDNYLRFFTASRMSSEALAAMFAAEGVVAFGAFRDGRLLGVAHYRLAPAGTDPEVAVAVAHGDQHHGVASLLLEHLVAAARDAGVQRLSAEVLTTNHTMIRVLRDSGLPLSSTTEHDVRHMVLYLPPITGSGLRSEEYADAVLDRAAHADLESLRPVMAPRSVVVIGAGRRPDSVGRLVLRQIVEGGFTGPVHVVNPHAAAVGGVPCRRAVADLPHGIDTAVLCVPAAAVPDVAEQCGRQGVRALLVITAGVTTDPDIAARLAAVLDRYGMRMVGPNCVGLINTDPAVRLQATFGGPARAGTVGLAAQSGGVAIALTAELDRLGLGVSTAVSTGDSVDVNGDDLLLWWAQDGRTEAAVLYLESLRRPRQFARLARRLAGRMPVLTLRSGSSDAGRKAAASHTAGTATPRVVRDALFAQAGVLAVDELGELSGVLAVLSWQPLPAGPRVAVLSNAGGAGVLAADACARYGLVVQPLSPATREGLAALLPDTAVVTNPVDVTATVSAAAYGRVVERVLADPDVDAVLVISVPTGAGDPLAGIVPVTDGRPGKPVVAVRLGQAATVERLTVLGAATDVPVPAFADPAAAARALNGAVRRATWLRRPPGLSRPPRRVDATRAREVVDTALVASPQGGWLEPEQAAELAAAAGLPLAATTVVHSVAAALRCWRDHGGPVALKADVPGVLHKSREGAVRTGLDSRQQIAEAVRGFRTLFGARLRGIVVQPMASAGVELLVGVTGDALCGPLLTVGLGGTTTDLVDDRSHCLVPATDADLDELVDGLRAAPRLLGGDHGSALRASLRDAAARLGWLADQLPEVAEAEINPLVVGPEGAVAVDLRIRLEPARVTDPWLRTLPV
ncbi:GNAT family N-acetyltransferase [Pseudonocardia sp. GCM10023141]|uniref:bifunctional acetate--CoA ligase family protein/GNAT family N-acetyltransferase n=1 Tax=Pseudonocardia sp. GCM10023141 TaxID=3252653 RepID=UPI00361CD0F8